MQWQDCSYLDRDLAGIDRISLDFPNSSDEIAFILHTAKSLSTRAFSIFYLIVSPLVFSCLTPTNVDKVCYSHEHGLWTTVGEFRLTELSLLWNEIEDFTVFIE
jgi:hypothetical protein